MKEKGLSQDDLTIKAYINKSYLAEVELSKANPTVGFLRKIARGLKVKITEFTEGI